MTIDDTPTVTASSDSTPYTGMPLAYPDSDVTVTGANGLTNSDGTLSYTYNGSPTAPSAPGAYAVLITFTPTDTTDYTTGTQNATWTISPAVLTVTTDDQSMTYGGSVPTLTDTISGYVNGDTSSVVSGVPSLSTPATSSSGVGTYAVTATQGSLSADNYTFTFVAGTLTVNPYAFTYYINNDTQAYGTAANLASDLPASINTGVNGETLNIAYSSTGDTTTAGVGNYDITGVVSDGSGSSSNYNVTLVNGTLTVNPYALTYYINNDTQTFGSAANLASDLPASINTGVNGETLNIAYSSTGDIGAAPVGAYDITGTLSDGSGSSSNYNVTLVNGTLTVNPYAFTYYVNNDTQTYGSAADLTSDLPASINTGVNGETLGITYYSAGDTATTVVGTYDIIGTLSDGSGSSSNYNVTLVNGTLTVNPYAFTYYINNDTQTYGSAADLASDLPASINTGVNGETLSITYSSTGDTVTADVGAYDC